MSGKAQCEYCGEWTNVGRQGVCDDCFLDWVSEQEEQ
jgi:NMD protein affecting ribosome stability and mRNA decay